MRSRFFRKIGRAFNTSIRAPLDANSALTRVRIWESGYFTEESEFIKTNVANAMLKISTKEANIGHVSVETNLFYASLWPRYLTILNKYKVQPGQKSQLLDDFDAEGRNPDHLIDFTKLNMGKVSEELKKFEDDSKYHLVGGSKFFNKNGAYNCSSLAYSLLLAGGLKTLLPTNTLIQDYIIVTPNNLAKLLIKAKKNEERILSLEKISGNSNSNR